MSAKAISAVLERLGTVYKARGPTGLVAFLGTRLFHRRADLLYEIDLRDWRQMPGERLSPVARISADNVGDPSIAGVRAQVLAGEGIVHLSGLMAADLCFAYCDRAGKVLTYAFVLFETQYKRVLGVPTAVPLIGNCFTAPESRGKGLYPAMLRAVCDSLAADGHDKATISVAPDNEASVRGIEKAGFVRVAKIRCWMLLSRLTIARTVEP